MFACVRYGDLVPDSSAGRLFTALFALTGVAFLGIALGVIGNNIIETQELAVEQASGLAQSNAMQLFLPSSEPPQEPDAEQELLDPLLAHPRQRSSKSPWYQFLLELSMVAFLLILFASLLSDDPGMESSTFSTTGWRPVADALYYAVISASTVGYGDMAPTTQSGRLVAIVAIPLAVGVMGHWLSFVASYIMQSKQDAMMKRRMKRELTLADLDVMDKNKDGSVSQLEFMEFMLVRVSGLQNRSATDSNSLCIIICWL